MDVMMPEMDGYETMRAIRAAARVQAAADHRADRQGDEGRPREVHRGRRVRLHHQAGRHRAAALADARVALPVETQDAGARARADRDRAPARGDLPPLRLRLPRYAPAVAAAARCGSAMDGERARDDLGAAGAGAARPGGDGAAAARPLGQRHRDVPRPDLLPRVPREGRAAAAHLSVHRASGTPAARRAKRSTRWRSCSRRKGCSTAAASTRPTSTRRCSSRRGSASSRWTRCRSTRRTTSRAGGDALVLRVLHRRATTARASPASSPRTSSSRSTTSSPTRSFNEFNVILCRNVLIYFDEPLQERVHELFYDSLAMFGVLGAGQKETIRFSPHERSFEELDAEERLFRKVSMSYDGDRDRRVLGRAAGSGNVARGDSAAARPGDRGRAAPLGRVEPRRARVAAAAPHRPARLRARRQGAARAAPRLRRAGRLPPARRGQPLRPLRRRARPVRAPVDRRALRVGRRGLPRPRDRDRAHGRERGRRRRPGRDQAERRRLDRPGPAHGGAADDAGRGDRAARSRTPCSRSSEIATVPLRAVLPGDATGRKLLLVDDRPENLLALEAILEPLDADLVRAASGEEALRRLLHEEFAAILLDVQMPGMDGFQTAELIKQRERTRHVPILFLTAISKDAEHIFRGYSAGRRRLPDEAVRPAGAADEGRRLHRALAEDGRDQAARRAPRRAGARRGRARERSALPLARRRGARRSSGRRMRTA